MSETPDFYRSEPWRRISAARRSFALHRCELCNAADDLSVHHRTYERFGGNEEIGDLICLCWRCHGLFHEKNQEISDIGEKMAQDAFHAGALYGVLMERNRRLDRRRKYALFGVRSFDGGIRLFFDSEGALGCAAAVDIRKAAGRFMRWMTAGYPGCADLNEHKAAAREAEEARKSVRARYRAAEREPILVIWERDFAPQLKDILSAIVPRRLRR